MDRSEFEREFPALRAELLGYLFRLSTRREDAEDLAQETYLKALAGLDRFSGRSSLKTWVFAIATNLARDHARVRSRWDERGQDRCRADAAGSPDKKQRMMERVRAGEPERYDFREHIDFCFSCMAKTLPITEQLAVILKEIYQFKVAEIVEVLGSTEGKVKHALAGGRRTLTEIYDSRCALINKAGACHQCSEIAGMINPKAQEQVRRMQLAGDTPEKLLAMRSALVRAVDPLSGTSTPLHELMLELVEQQCTEVVAD